MINTNGKDVGNKRCSYQDMGKNLSIAIAGDVWLGGSRRIKMIKDPKFLALRDIILANDVAYVNMETCFLDKSYQGPYYASGKGDEGESHSAEPRIARDLKWMGFDICSCAMNHSYDYGPEGILSTIRVLEDSCFTFAGIGKDLDSATAPGFIQTSKGMISIISAYANDDFPFQSALNPTKSGCVGKPGVNNIRVDFLLDPETWENTKSMLNGLGLRTNIFPWWTKQFGGETFELKGHYYFVKGKGEGKYIRTQVRNNDLNRNTRTIKEAAGMSDWVIYACHYHTPTTRYDAIGNPKPTEAIETLAKESINAGADMFIGTGGSGGPSQGIEIYKNKPIFWNIGVFIENVESMTRQPETIYEMMGLGPRSPINELHDRLNKRVWKDPKINDPEVYWSGMLASIDFIGRQGPKRKVKRIKLYPCDLHGNMSRSIRGYPSIADSAFAHRVLERVAQHSEAYGTEITIRNGIGIINP